MLAEFIIAFMPISAMFLCVCQLSRYELAHIVVMRAAEVSARACAVIYEPMPGHEKEVDGKDEDVVEAAHVVMEGVGGGPNGNSELTITDPQCKHSGDANGGEDEVTVNAVYHCTIPIADKIVCSTGDKAWTEKVSFPHQGADYHLDEAGD